MILSLEQAINVIEKEICEYFKEDSSGHDVFHLKRVLNLALQIQAVEKGDIMVIGIASFVHDIHRTMQDADNLDAIGAIGIARVFAYGGSVGNKIYEPAKNIESNYEGDAKAAYSGKSSIHHIREKLLKLKDNMNTKTGRLLAEERHVFMELYLNQFYKEWGNVI